MWDLALRVPALNLHLLLAVRPLANLSQVLFATLYETIEIILWHVAGTQ